MVVGTEGEERNVGGHSRAVSRGGGEFGVNVVRKHPRRKAAAGVPALLAPLLGCVRTDVMCKQGLSVLYWNVHLARVVCMNCHCTAL